MNGIYTFRSGGLLYLQLYECYCSARRPHPIQKFERNDVGDCSERREAVSQWDYRFHCPNQKGAKRKWWVWRVPLWWTSTFPHSCWLDDECRRAVQNFAMRGYDAMIRLQGHTKYRYLQVSLRKKDSIRSSCDLSMTLWSVAYPQRSSSVEIKTFKYCLADSQIKRIFGCLIVGDCKTFRQATQKLIHTW